MGTTGSKSGFNFGKENSSFFVPPEIEGNASAHEESSSGLYIDISYSDLGGIVNPEDLKNTIITNEPSGGASKSDDFDDISEGVFSPDSQPEDPPKLTADNNQDYDTVSTKIPDAADVSSARNSDPNLGSISEHLLPKLTISDFSKDQSTNLNDLKLEEVT